MEIYHYRHSIVNRQGNYVGTITEGDVLWYIKNRKQFDLGQAENIPMRRVPRVKDYTAVSVLAPIEDVLSLAVQQNYIPVVDDQQIFIGIIRRQSVIRYLTDAFSRGG
jgi:CBS domain-containing protein